jgi:tRNA-Thr(GGU) m(6)t(6)A37 methyltransferase TsaA
MEPHPPEDHDATLALRPIGRFHCAERYPYDAARQGALADNVGEVHLFAGCGYEQALRDVDGFSHLWLLFWFDRNDRWKPIVTPPRGTRRVGVFASRSPHRPNPVGMSLVRLERVEGRRIVVRGHDLLDGTPILDIKPYLPYADSVAEARVGWLAEVEKDVPWSVAFTESAEAELAWLAQRGVGTLTAFLRREARRPTDSTRKRVRSLAAPGRWEIAYRTWRAVYEAAPSSRSVQVLQIRSGYAASELAPGQPDRYNDHALHRDFVHFTPHEV